MANDNGGEKPANTPETNPEMRPEVNPAGKIEINGSEPKTIGTEQPVGKPAAEKPSVNGTEPAAEKNIVRPGAKPDAPSEEASLRPSDGARRSRKGHRQGDEPSEGKVRPQNDPQAGQDKSQAGPSNSQNGKNDPQTGQDKSQAGRRQSRRGAQPESREEDRPGRQSNDRRPRQDGAHTNAQYANRSGRNSATVAATAADANSGKSSTAVGKTDVAGGRTTRNEPRNESRTDRTARQNERGNGSAERAAGNEAKKGRQNSLKRAPKVSPEPARGTRAASKSGGKWTWREYALQLLVVLVGVMVTLIGSSMVARWQEQRKVRSMMQLVYAELNTNAREMDRICRHLDHDRRGMRLLKEYGMDYRSVPVDSLKEYQYVLGVISDFDLRSDALEVLRTAGTMPAAKDRQLLFEVLECYSWMERFAASVEKYNEQKMRSLNHLFVRGLNGAIGGPDPLETWRVMMDDNMCAAFIGMMGEYFADEALEDGPARIEAVTRMLNEKYGFE